MVKLFVILVILVALGWMGYGAWQLKIYLDEKKKPAEEQGKREKSEKLKEAEKSFEDFAKKMAEYKKKPYERQ